MAEIAAIVFWIALAFTLAQYGREMTTAVWASRRAARRAAREIRRIVRAN